MTSSTGPPRSRERHRRSDGFTLVEILVVLVIIATLSAAAVPMLRRSVGDARLRGAARDLAAELAMGREAAVATSATRRIELSDLRGARLAEGSDHAAVFDPGGTARPARFVLEGDQARLIVELNRAGRIRIVAP